MHDPNTNLPPRVLVVAPDPKHRLGLMAALGGSGSANVVAEATDAQAALELLESVQPDAVVLAGQDLGQQHPELLVRIREAGEGIGVIVVCPYGDSACAESSDSHPANNIDYVFEASEGTKAQRTASLRAVLLDSLHDWMTSRRDAGVANLQRTRQPKPILPSPSDPRSEGRLEGSSRGLPPRRPPRRSEQHSTESPPSSHARQAFQVVALGISTGGPQALMSVLPQLPADLPVGILIVQHMPPDMTASLAEDLDRRCQLRVLEASDQMSVQPGHVYIAPGGFQMKVVREGPLIELRIADDPCEQYRPSVNYLFRSVAEVYGPRAVGVIMTGMGTDGTEGCRELKRQGASIIAQDQASCVVFGMPRLPIAEGLADVVAPVDRIAEAIRRQVARGGAHAGRP